MSTFVRDRQSFDLETAVHMLSQRPAQVFGIEDRGFLAEDGFADVVIFDAHEVGLNGKRRVFDLPSGADRLISDAVGISAVIVTGTVIREDGAATVSSSDSLPGKLLRNGKV